MTRMAYDPIRIRHNKTVSLLFVEEQKQALY
jgi:hypothetical protein